MAGEAKVDNLQIQVKASSKTAANALDTLRKSLVALRDTIAGGGFDGLIRMSATFDTISDGSGKIKSFTNSVRSMAKAMDEGSSSMGRFRTSLMETVMTVGTAKGMLDDLGFSLDTITTQSNGDNGVAGLSEQLSDMSQQLGAISEYANTASSSLSELEKSANKSASGIKTLGKESKKTRRETKRLGLSAESITKPFDRLISSIGRIALYRAIRSAIKNVTSAIKEGLTNLEGYSRIVGSEFAPAVDDLRRHVLLLKNAFATALRPVIEAVIPLIIQLCDWLSKAADFVAQVLSALTGQVDDKGRYTKAILSDLEDSNKQAKELRRTLLGFDEINRLDGDNGSGKSDNTGLMFTKAEISPEAAATAGKLKEAIKWIKDAINSIDWNVVLRVLEILVAMKLAKMLASAAKWIITIGLKMAIIVGIIYALAEYGDKIAEKIRESKREVDAFFENIKGKVKGSDGLTALVQLVQDVFDTFSEGFSTLSSGIYKLFHGDFKGALKDLVHLVAVIIKGIINLFAGIWNVVAGFFSDIVYWISLGIRWIHNEVIVPVVNWFATGIEKIKVAWKNTIISAKISWKEFMKFLIEIANKHVLYPLEIRINEVIFTLNSLLKKDYPFVSIHIDADTEEYDKEIAALEATRPDPITQTVELMAKWEKLPERLNLKADTTGLTSAIDEIEKRIYRAIDGVEKRVNSVYDAAGNLKPGAARNGAAVQRYASGGFPSAGSLMIAGESGPELVANFGGQTGVWNAEQMSKALYDAVSAAMAKYGGGGGDIYLDGEVIYRNTVRRNNNQVRSTGRSALLT